MVKGAKTRYAELRRQMKAVSKLKPKTWDNPPFLILEMRDGQSVFAPSIHDVDPNEFDNPKMKEIVAAVLEHGDANLPSLLKNTKIKKATMEDLPFGKLYDLTITFGDGKKQSIRKMAWVGQCTQFLGKPKLADQHQCNLPEIRDVFREQHKYHRLALAAANEEGLGYFVEVVTVHKRQNIVSDFFRYLTDHTIVFKAQNQKSDSGEVISPKYAFSVLEAKWIHILDDDKASFYRFRNRVTMETMKKVSDSCKGRDVLMAEPKYPLSDVDLVSPRFEFPAILCIELHNIKERSDLKFDRVVSGAEVQRCGKEYPLVIQAKSVSGEVCHIKMEICQKPSRLEISSFYRVPQEPEEAVSSVRSARRGARPICLHKHVHQGVKRAVSTVESIEDEKESVRRTRSGRKFSNYSV